MLPSRPAAGLAACLAAATVTGLAGVAPATASEHATAPAPRTTAAHGTPPARPQGTSRPGVQHPAVGLARALGTHSTSDVTVAHGSRGQLTFVGTSSGRPLPRPAGLGPRTAPAQAAAAFVRAHAAVLGAAGRSTALRVASVSGSSAAPGATVVHLRQRVAGHPVLGGEVSVALTPDDAVTSVVAHLAPSATTLPPATVRARTAARIAAEATARAHRITTAALHAGRAHLVVADPALLTGGEVAAAEWGGTRLAWQVDVTGAAAARATGANARDTVSDAVVVDATDGRVLLSASRLEALSSVQTPVCDANHRRTADDDLRCPASFSTTTASDDPDVDVRDAREFAALTYDFYASVAEPPAETGVPPIGVARNDGSRRLASVVHVCRSGSSTGATCGKKLLNAFWDGQEMVYGDGYAQADDVVAHELTHSFTAHTSDLFYWYQSGSINESMSDVLGELVDQWDTAAAQTLGIPGRDAESDRWLLGEDLPGGAVRDMADPTASADGAQPDRMTSPYYAGGQRADSATGQAVPADSGDVHTDSGVGNKAAYLIVDGTGAGSFNGVTVPGLGGRDAATRAAAIAKAAEIYYRADELLTSGADYADLGRVLPQACADLVGTQTRTGDEITSTDCDTVSLAVRATEMERQPATASAPEAPTCGSSPMVVHRGVSDDFEDPSRGLWSRSPGSGGPWYYPAGRNIYGDPQHYAHSGTDEAWGDDVDPQYLAANGYPPHRDGTLAMTRAFRVPVGKAAYLWFAHAFHFEWYDGGAGGSLFTDGGRVEYSTDGGRSWHSAGGLFDSHGYNHRMHGLSADGRTEIYSFRGFGGDSHGYISSRLDLTPLAGTSVRFRFRVTADAAVGGYGWYVDDVTFFTCGPQPAAPAPVAATPGVGALTVTWAAPADSGTSPVSGYRVQVRSGSTTVASVLTAAGARSARLSGLPQGVPLRATVTASNATATGPAAASRTLHGTRVSLTASASSVRSGQSLTLSGHLRDDADHALAGRTVSLWESSGSGWTRAARATTGSTGRFAFALRPQATLTYRVRFGGAPPYQGSVSPSRRVTVS